MTARQLSIDFDRNTQGQILRNLRLPSLIPSGNTTISAQVVISVLKMIDDRIRTNVWCYVAIETLAEVAHLSPRTVKRAIKVLDTLCLVTIQRRKTPSGTVCNHYKMVWEEIDARGQNLLSQQTYTTHKKGDVPSDQGDVPSDQGDVPSDQGDVPSPKDPLRPNTPPEDQRGAADCGSVPDFEDAPANAIATRPVDLWVGVRADLEHLGFRATREIISSAKAVCQSPTECLAAAQQAIATAKHNGQVFKDSVAAAAYFLINRSWPADAKDVKDPDREREFRTKQLAEQNREHLFNEIIKSGRRERRSDEEIAACLFKRLPADWLAAKGGWTKPLRRDQQPTPMGAHPNV